MTRTLLLAAAVLALMTGCGGGDDSDPSNPFDADNYPKCSDVWQVGKTLPKVYEGCARDDGDIEAAVSSECDDGTELVGYDDRLFALTGDKVQEGTVDDENYKEASGACKPS